MWAKVDDRLFMHPKVLAAGVAAMGLWVVSMSYAACYGTDGNVPSKAIEALASNLASKELASASFATVASELATPSKATELAERLVEAGLWERTEQGYRFHDWGQYNPTKKTQGSETTGKRLSRAEAGRLGGLKRQANKQALEASKELAMLGSNAPSKPSPVPVPDPNPNKEVGERNVPSSPVGSTEPPAPPPTEPVEPELPPGSPTDETEPPPMGEVSPEIKLGTKVCRIFEDFSGGVISSLNFATAHFYRVGVVAKELREKHNIGSEEWKKLARWLGPRGPGLKGRDKPVSLELLLRNDAAWLRDCMSEAMKWNENAGYNGRS